MACVWSPTMMLFAVILRALRVQVQHKKKKIASPLSSISLFSSSLSKPTLWRQNDMQSSLETTNPSQTASRAFFCLFFLYTIRHQLPSGF
ncbi:hypothetical protein BGZ63DRAFT_374344 [Mariannaea sp. PMI_226]|nr:hypothetical protein BGZ63DRAFT_374344 [Mariannaea sp. PMI_226]